MAVDIAMSANTFNYSNSNSTSTSSGRRSFDLGRTSSLPAPQPLLRIAVDDHATSPFSPSSNPTAPLTWRPGPPIATESGKPTKLRTALDFSSGKILAVKSVTSASLPREMRQLEAEQAALERLRGCSNVVQLICTDSTESSEGILTKSLLLEFVSGGSIADIIARYKGALPESLARRYARGILQGLANVHSAGMVHCDVSSRNVLVSGATGLPKLCSFGFAMREGEAAERVARKQRLQGTYQWMAPEVIRQEDQSQASDIWSFACTFVEMLSGSPPWDSQVDGTISALADFIGRSSNLPDLPAGISTECARFLQRCLQREPSLRPTAQELLRDPFMEASSPSNSWSAPQRSPLPRNPALLLSQKSFHSPRTRGQSSAGNDGVTLPQLAALDAVIERPRSPDGHEGICRETLQKASLARQQSGGLSNATVQIWQRDEPPGKGAPAAQTQAWQGADSSSSRTANPPMPTSASTTQIWQRDPQPLERTTSLQAPVQAPNIPPGISQLLASPQGVKMGPLMRQISRDAQEFARLQMAAAVAAQEPAAASAQANRPATASCAAVSPIRPMTAGPAAATTQKPRITAPGTSGAGHFSPAAPSSPRSNSPLPPSPRKNHRRAGSVADSSPLSTHRRSGSMQVDALHSFSGGSSAGGAGAHRRSGSVQVDSSFGLPPAPVSSSGQGAMHRRSGSTQAELGYQGAAYGAAPGGGHRRAGSGHVESSGGGGASSPLAGSRFGGSSSTGSPRGAGANHRRAGSMQSESVPGLSLDRGSMSTPESPAGGAGEQRGFGSPQLKSSLKKPSVFGDDSQAGF